MATVRYEVVTKDSPDLFARTEEIPETLTKAQAIHYAMGLMFEDSWCRGGNDANARIILNGMLVWEEEI